MTYFRTALLALCLTVPLVACQRTNNPPDQSNKMGQANTPPAQSDKMNPGNSGSPPANSAAPGQPSSGGEKQ